MNFKSLLDPQQRTNNLHLVKSVPMKEILPHLSSYHTEFQMKEMVNFVCQNKEVAVFILTGKKQFLLSDFFLFIACFNITKDEYNEIVRKLFSKKEEFDLGFQENLFQSITETLWEFTNTPFVNEAFTLFIREVDEKVAMENFNYLLDEEFRSSFEKAYKMLSISWQESLKLFQI